MTRPHFAIAAILALAAASSACAPQCTCPASVPAPAAGPPPVANPMPAPAPGAQPAPAPAAGSVRLLNEGPAVRRMRSAYPAHLLAGGTRGDVTVEVTLDADGGVQSAVAISANNDQFRGPATTVAQELRFSAPPPGVTTVRVRLRFQPAGSRIDVVPSP